VPETAGRSHGAYRAPLCALAEQAQPVAACRSKPHWSILAGWAPNLARASTAVRSGIRRSARADDAKEEIRAAVRYLLQGTTDGIRGDIVQGIISIVRQVAAGMPPEQPNSLDDGLHGG
jgi:hypothetical protein